MFNAPQVYNGAAYVPFQPPAPAPPPDITGAVRRERPDPRYSDRNIVQDDARARPNIPRADPIPQAPPLPDYAQRRIAEGIPPAAFQGMSDFFQVQRGYQTRQATAAQAERDRPPAEGTRSRRQRLNPDRDGGAAAA